jgi:transposase-like protein
MTKGRPETRCRVRKYFRKARIAALSLGENGLLKQLTKQLLERAMSAEMTVHVGYEKHRPDRK